MSVDAMDAMVVYLIEAAEVGGDADMGEYTLEERTQAWAQVSKLRDDIVAAHKTALARVEALEAALRLMSYDHPDGRACWCEDTWDRRKSTTKAVSVSAPLLAEEG